ncbi:uncharacterized protein LOC118276896 [Spodoptera frugiperda]|uniref:Uncharacterized protein LOC118276896 n=1 Tax=Spodoptera frugiperda TaxID=7108 RepID=A0A9R0EZF5_SPOFR|nr:uncharacterized protein LOC118276896 [Spodoptera frugiperda]
MKEIIIPLCVNLFLLVFSDAVPLKLIPGERNVIKDKGVTHTISRFYVVPEDFGDGTTVKALRSDLASSETSESEDSVTEDLLERVEDGGSSTEAYRVTDEVEEESSSSSSSTKLLRTSVTTVLTKLNVINETSNHNDLSHLLVQPVSRVTSTNSSASWNATREGEETHEEILTETVNNETDDETNVQAVSDDTILEDDSVKLATYSDVENITSSNFISQQGVDDSEINADSLLRATVLTGESDINVNEEVSSDGDSYSVTTDVENVVPIVYALDEPTIINENDSISLQQQPLEESVITDSGSDVTDLATEDKETGNLRSRIDEEYTDPWSIVSKMGNDVVWTKEDKTIKDITVKNDIHVNDKKDNDGSWIIVKRVKNYKPSYIEDKTDSEDGLTIVDRIKADLSGHIDDKHNNIPSKIEETVKNYKTSHIGDKNDNVDLWTIVERIKNGVPWHIEDKTPNAVPWTIVERIKSYHPWHIEDKKQNDIPVKVEARVKNDIPWQPEDQKTNTGLLSIVERIEKDLPWHIDDKRHNDIPWTILERIKSGLPWPLGDEKDKDIPVTVEARVKNDIPSHIDDETDNGDRETIVDTIKNDLPSNLEDKTTDKDSWEIDEIDEKKRYIEDNTDYGDQTIMVEKVKEDLDSYSEEKTSVNVPLAIDDKDKNIEEKPEEEDSVTIVERFKNDLPSYIEDTTVYDAPKTIVEGAQDEHWTIEEKFKKDILSTIKHLPLTKKTTDYNLPGSIEDRIKEDILTTIEGRGSNQPRIIKKETTYNLPLIVEDRLGDTNYVVKKKIYKNVPWTSGNEVVGTGPWHISQLPTTGQYPATISKQGYAIKDTNKQPYHVYTYVVHPPSVEASTVSQDRPDIDHIINVKSTKYTTKLAPSVENIYKLSTIHNPTETVHVNKPSTYELQHNIGTSSNIVPGTLHKYTYNIKSDVVAPKTPQNEVTNVYSNIISQSPQNDDHAILDHGTNNPKVTHEYKYTLETNVVTPKTPRDESHIINTNIISQKPQDYNLNLNSGSNNPKVSHEYIYKVKSQVPKDHNIYSGVTPQNVQDYSFNVNSDIVNPKITHEYTYNVENNVVTPKTPQDYSADAEASAVFSPNKDVVTPVTSQDVSYSTHSGNVVPNTQNYNLNIDSGVTPKTPVDYSHVQKDILAAMKPGPDSKIILSTDHSSLNLPQKQLQYKNPQSYKWNLEVTKQQPSEDRAYLYENVIKRPTDVSTIHQQLVKPEYFDYYQTQNLELAPTYKLFTLQNLLKLADGLKRLKLPAGTNAQEHRALDNLRTVLEILLIQADYFGKDNDWYEKIFHDVPPQNRHPLQLYTYHLIRQRWLHDLLLILQKNNFDLDILLNPGVISLLESWKFPQYVQNYLEAEHILGKGYVQQNNIVNPLDHRVVNNNDCQNCAVDVDNFIAKHVLNGYSPKKERLILNIAGVGVEPDADAVKGILQKYLVNKHAIEDQENVIMQDNKTEMLKQIILYLKHKHYRTEIIFDLIHKLNSAVLPTLNQGCAQQDSISQNIYDVILPTLRRSLE